MFAIVFLSPSSTVDVSKSNRYVQRFTHKVYRRSFLNGLTVV